MRDGARRYMLPDIPRARRPVVALMLRSSGCTAAALAFKPLAAVFFLLGWLACLRAWSLVARLHAGTAGSRRAWIAGAALVTLGRWGISPRACLAKEGHDDHCGD